MVELLRRGAHPFDLLGIGNLLHKITAALGKLLAQWHSQYGTNAGASVQGLILGIWGLQHGHAGGRE